jgi:hypothetical protein
MLCEEVSTVKVVIVYRLFNIRFDLHWAEIAAPEAELDVLGTNVSLPFVL